MKEGRDIYLQPLLDEASDNSVAEIMDSRSFIYLYTSGSTGKPKGMVHTTAGYMVYTAYTFKNVFNYEENDLLVYGRYWLDNGAFLYSLRSLIEWSDNGDF
jgi:acetyl-CoA synthetase